MTNFLFVRHGEANYKPIDERGFIGHGRDLSPLTNLGIKQLKEAAKEPLLKGSDLIIASPYTRALQSAAILSKELNLDIRVEVDLHEWIPDIVNFSHATTKDCITLAKDFNAHGGVHPLDDIKVWETTAQMEKRMDAVLEKYMDYRQVIVVCHGMVIRTQKNQKVIRNGEIIEVLK